jgi:hypothetical protein
VLPLSTALGILSYSVFYYGWLAVNGYPALIGFQGSQSTPQTAAPQIRFLDVLLPSRASVLQAFLIAGPQQGGSVPTPGAGLPTNGAGDAGIAATLVGNGAAGATGAARAAQLVQQRPG